jgi:hypothetical protein
MLSNWNKALKSGYVQEKEGLNIFRQAKKSVLQQMICRRKSENNKKKKAEKKRKCKKLPFCSGSQTLLRIKII